MFGEIVLCDFPFSSGTAGKVRPALVLFDLHQDEHGFEEGKTIAVIGVVNVVRGLWKSHGRRS